MKKILFIFILVLFTFTVKGQELWRAADSTVTIDSVNILYFIIEYRTIIRDSTIIIRRDTTIYLGALNNTIPENLPQDVYNDIVAMQSVAKSNLRITVDDWIRQILVLEVREQNYYAVRFEDWKLNKWDFAVLYNFDWE